jgi:hypothetical protein
MTSALPIPQNPYFTVANGVVTVNCNKKTIPFNITDIKKMYLRKNSSYWYQMIGQLLSAPSQRYDLHIETESQGICITINPIERYYFIKLINQLRESRKTYGVKHPFPNQFHIQTA